MNFFNFRIGTRLYISFATVILLLVVLVSIAHTNFIRLGKANGINEHIYMVMDKVNGALRSLTNIETGERGFALTGNELSLELFRSGKDDFAKYLQEAKELTINNPAQQESLAKLEQDQKQWLEIALDPVIKLRREGKMNEVIASEQEGRGKKNMDAMRASIADILGAEQTSLVKSEDVLEMQSFARTSLLGGGIVAIVLAMLIAIWMARNITRPLRYAVDIARRVAAGDLTGRVTVTSKDEIAELLNALQDMNDALVCVVHEVRSGTDAIVTASGQISAGTLDLSERTEQQASSLEETASSTEELASTVKQNADNAYQANQLAKSASEVAMTGGAVVSEVVETMGKINASSNKIVEIISVIDSIAFQTNILALNAAVEAARAGEQGRGFAVVAAEVRSLAQRSAGAAKEIKVLIGDSVEKVSIGTRLVDDAGATMKAIVDSIRNVTDIMSEITVASREQTSGIEQVNLAISQMDEVTQQNAALVEESNDVAGSLAKQARQLAQVVSVFKTEGAKGASARPEPVLRSVEARPAARTQVAPKRQFKATERTRIAAAPSASSKGPSAASVSGDQWEEF